jgi:hypothetical protein
MPLLRVVCCKQRHGAQRLIIMERPLPILQTVNYAASRERPWGRRTLMAGLMLAAFASRALLPPVHAGKRPTASVEPDGQGTTQDVVAFTSSDGKFRTGMYKAGPEHQECKSG